MSKGNYLGEANLAKAIKESRNSFEIEKSRVDNSSPDGWRIEEVPGDGSCGFHAIMKCLLFQGNNNYIRISNNPSLRATLKNRKINFNEKAGFALRYYLARKLEKIRDEISSYKVIMNNKTIPRSNKVNVNKRLQDLINTYKLNFIVENNQAGISEKNIENPVSYLNAIIKNLEDFKINKSTNEWLTQQILVIIAPILKKNIFIFYRKKWTSILYEKPYNQNNSIFLKYDGIHYDALIRSDKMFKNSFNIPSDTVFNYNFFK